MQIHNLKRVHPVKKTMQVGRGGKRGKTSGRGGKGQTARAGNKRRPEMRDLIKKLPKLRGRGVNPLKSFEERFVPINLALVEEVFNAGEQVSPISLVEKGVVEIRGGKLPKIKILGTGEITKKLSFERCAFSGSARAKIEKAGSTIIS